jgi:hypothetical protein
MPTAVPQHHHARLRLAIAPAPVLGGSTPTRRPYACGAQYPAHALSRDLYSFDLA